MVTICRLMGPEPLKDARGLRGEIGSFTAFAAVPNIPFFIALGNIAEACVEQIPCPKLLEPRTTEESA